LIWIYIKHYFKWNYLWVIELVSLLALVSLLGVANELFELLIVHIGLTNLHLTDTSWDLLMNTLGAVTVWMIYVLLRIIRGNKFQ
jgi:glycopeptide antibiotics resistance protein